MTASVVSRSTWKRNACTSIYLWSRISLQSVATLDIIWTFHESLENEARSRFLGYIRPKEKFQTYNVASMPIMAMNICKQASSLIITQQARHINAPWFEGLLGDPEELWILLELDTAMQSRALTLATNTRHLLDYCCYSTSLVPPPVCRVTCLERK